MLLGEHRILEIAPVMDTGIDAARIQIRDQFLAFRDDDLIEMARGYAPNRRCHGFDVRMSGEPFVVESANRAAARVMRIEMRQLRERG